MGMQLPEWTRKIFLITIGDGWPEADEDGLWALSREWTGLGIAVDELHMTMLEPIRVVRRSDWDGPAERVFALTGQCLSGAVADMRTATQDVARFVDDTAVNVQYMKILVLEQLVILAGQIAHLLTSSYWTFGASLPAAAQLAALGKLFAVKAVQTLAMSIPTVVLMSGGVDAVTQLAQLAQGRRRHWDDKLSLTALIGAAIGLTLGPVARQAGQLLGERLQSMVSTRVAGVTQKVVTDAGHAYFTTGVTGTALGQGWSGSPWDLTSGAVGGAVQGFSGGAELTTVDVLHLDGGGRGLGDRVFEAGPGPVHRLADLPAGAGPGDVAGGVFATGAVFMDHFGHLAAPGDRGHVQGGDDQAGVRVGAHRVAGDAPEAQVDDGGEVALALTGDLGHVAAPGDIRRGRGEHLLDQSPGGRTLLLEGQAPPAPLGPGDQTQFGHQLGDRAVGDLPALLAPPSPMRGLP